MFVPSGVSLFEGLSTSVSRVAIFGRVTLEVLTTVVTGVYSRE